MNTLETSVSAVAIAICLIGVFLVRQLPGRLSLRFLVAYLLLEAFGLGTWWLLANPESPYKALWLGLFMATSFLMAPTLWLLAMETSTNQQPSLKSLSSVEWSVIALGMLLTVPLIMSAHGGIFIVDPARRGVQTFLVSYVHETMLVCIALFLLQVPFYLRKSFAIVRQHTARDFGLFSNIDDMPLNTLRVLMWLMLGNWVLSLARTSRSLLIEGTSLLDPLFTCIKGGITLWALAIILKRALLLSAAAPQNNLDVKTINNAEESDQANKYARSALDTIIRERIERKLKTAMEEDRIFTRCNLKLRDLCSHLNENTHYVSQVINQGLGTSFYELVNQYRVEAAKQLLLENPESSVLDIAMEVGFNSKSPFNSAFKKTTGVTPKEYRKQTQNFAC